MDISSLLVMNPRFFSLLRREKTPASLSVERLCSLTTVVLAMIFIVGERAKVFAVSTLDAKTEILSFEQHDSDGDLRPEAALIMVRHLGELYRVAVFDQGLDMQWSNDWRTGTDFVNDVWIFQTHTGDLTRLIIRFSHDSAGYSAELFDETNNDGTVSWRFYDASRVDITESSFPTVHMVAKSPWTSREGFVNYFVHVTTYRPMFNNVGGGFEDVHLLPQDGRPGVEQEIVDSDADGIPDYELIRAFPDAPTDWNLFHTYINVNVSSKPPLTSFADPFLWPYLGSANLEEWNPHDLFRQPRGWGEDKSPPVQVDWSMGKILGVAHFLPFWGSGDQWKIQSWTPLTENALNELSWERYAYYSYSGSPMPDLAIGLRLGSPEDAVHLGDETLHLQTVWFSWKHENLGTLMWDYKLDVADLDVLPSTAVAFRDFSLREVPFEDYPQYYTEQEWAYATLVAAEDFQYPNNEGIREWATLHGVHVDISLPVDAERVQDSAEAQRDYLLGRTGVSPEGHYRDIREGFRGEFADLNAKVSLYLSPLDRKLHLFNAASGVWNLAGEQEIRYNSMGGKYIDQWTLVQYQETVKSLFFVSGYVICDCAGKVYMIRTAVQPAVFTTLPPRNKEEWLKLDAALDKYKPSFAPGDFESMLGQFGSPRTEISGATVRDFRLTPRGFRFILGLDHGFSTVSDPEGWASRLTLPGAYAVSFDGSAWEIRPATPVKLGAGELVVGEVGQPLRALDWSSISVSLRNGGLEDAHDLPVRLVLAGPPGEQEVLTTTVALLQAEDSEVVVWDWVPCVSGAWQARIEAGVAPGSGGGPPKRVLLTKDFDVEPGSLSRPEALLSLGNNNPPAVLSFLAGVTLLASGTVALWAAGRRLRGQP